jgi:hypothetical protein
MVLDPQALKNSSQGTLTLSQVIKNHIKAFMSGVHTMMPGEVVAYYSDGTADIQPLFQRQYDTSQNPLVYKPIPKVPIIYMGPNNGWLRFPLSVGDPVMLVFAERSIDKWFDQGGQAVPQDKRMFDLSDAVCIPGLRSSQQAITPNGDPASLELAFGDAWLEITSEGLFRLKNGATDAKTVLSDIVAMMETATSSPTGGPLIFVPPHDPATVTGEILDLFA